MNADETMLRVIYPYPISATDLSSYRLWVHGPGRTVLNELVVARGEKLGFLAGVQNLTSNLSFRLTLPKEHVGIDMFLNKSGVYALSEIEKVEAGKVTLQKTLNALRTVLIVLSSLYVVASLLLLKYTKNNLLYTYLILGLLLIIFNLTFRFNIVWIFFIILAPLLIKYINLRKEYWFAKEELKKQSKTVKKKVNTGKANSKKKKSKKA
jgi:hypothetical protein